MEASSFGGLLLFRVFFRCFLFCLFLVGFGVGSLRLLCCLAVVFGASQEFFFLVLVQVSGWFLVTLLVLCFFPFGPLPFLVSGPFNLCNSFSKINKFFA